MRLQLSIITVLFFTLMGLTSCSKKDWNCHCTVNGTEYNASITNTTKSDANKKCGDYGKRIGSQNGSYTYKCKVD